jgi:hypothetical protein
MLTPNDNQLVAYDDRVWRDHASMMGCFVVALLYQAFVQSSVIAIIEVETR